MEIQKKKKGGYRPGAGRKPKIVEDTEREFLKKISDKEWIDMLKKCKEMAIKGDFKSFVFLWERKFGRATEREEGLKEQVTITISHKYDEKNTANPSPDIFQKPVSPEIGEKNN